VFNTAVQLELGLSDVLTTNVLCSLIWLKLTSAPGRQVQIKPKVRLSLFLFISFYMQGNYSNVAWQKKLLLWNKYSSWRNFCCNARCLHTYVDGQNAF